MSEDLVEVALPLLAARRAHPLVREHLGGALIRPAANELCADAELFEGACKVNGFERKAKKAEVSGWIDETALRARTGVILAEARSAQMANAALTRRFEPFDGLADLFGPGDAEAGIAEAKKDAAHPIVHSRQLER